MGYNTDIVDDDNVSAYGKLIYFVLSKYVSKDGICWPSIKRIADNAGVSQNTVRRTIAELSSLDWLEVEIRKAGNGTNDTNLYFLPKLKGTSSQVGSGFTTGNTPLPDVKTNLSNKNYPINYNNISDDEKSILEYLPKISGYPFDEKKDIQQVREWLANYPSYHVFNELEKFNAWWRDKENSFKGKKNFRSSITNWLKKTKIEQNPSRIITNRLDLDLD